jgi:serine/threonine protein kinase
VFCSNHAAAAVRDSLVRDPKPCEVAVACEAAVDHRQKFRYMGVSGKANSAAARLAFVSSPTSDQRGPAEKKNVKLDLFKYKDLEVATGGFAEENLIGTSSHGNLYQGRLGDGRIVTVKRPSLHGRRLWQDEDAFENEVDILTKVFSRRLVNLLGYSQDAGKVKLLVMEFMENGSLHSQLHPQSSCSSAAAAADQDTSPESSTTLSWPLRVHLALQTAKALRALHSSSPPIVHRNIRAMNVFIDRSWNARLGEFGLARRAVSQDTAELIAPARKSNLSSIPESSEPETDAAAAAHDCGRSAADSGAGVFRIVINPETDVLSFGVLLLEIISGKNAMSLNADCSLSSLVDWALPLIKQGNALAICDPRIRLPLCATALKHMATIAARCLRPTGSRQPSMSEVVEVLTKVSKLIPLPLWNGHTTRVKSSNTQHAAQPSCFIMGLDSHALNCRIGRLVRLPMWVGFLKMKKQKRQKKTKKKNKTDLVMQQGIGMKSITGKFRKLKLSILNTPNQASNAAAAAALKVKGAKVSDEEARELHPNLDLVVPPAALVAAAPNLLSNRKPLEVNTNSQSLTIARPHQLLSQSRTVHNKSLNS